MMDLKLPFSKFKKKITLLIVFRQQHASCLTVKDNLGYCCCLQTFPKKIKINQKSKISKKFQQSTSLKLKTTKKKKSGNRRLNMLFPGAVESIFFLLFQILFPTILLCGSSLQENEENGQTTGALGVKGPRFKVPFSTDPSTSSSFSHRRTQPTLLGTTRASGKQVTAAKPRLFS